MAQVSGAAVGWGQLLNEAWRPFDSVLQWVGPAHLEQIAVATGFLCVWLAARESLWNFPVAIFSCLLYIIIYHNTKLYADRNLQVLFVLLSLYGWYEWLYGGSRRTELRVTHVQRWEWVGCALFIPLFTLGFGYYLQQHTDSTTPHLDSFTTAGSIAAQFLMMRKRLENWWLWIMVDLLYVPLLWYKELQLTSGLYALYLGLAAYGYWEWRQALRKVDNSPTTPSA